MGATAVVWTSVLSTISLTISIIVAFFFMGTRWAKMGSRVEGIDKRLARIEELFTMQLRRRNRGDADDV